MSAVPEGYKTATHRGCGGAVFYVLEGLQAGDICRIEQILYLDGTQPNKHTIFHAECEKCGISFSGPSGIDI